jgi:hypothetical protein
MSLAHSSSIVTNGLVMYYDMTNTAKSSLGAPTTNISTGIGIGTYLNTPSDVTSSLTVTTESYRGQPVYKQVLTPVTATGVSYLTNAGNPGIGTVTGGGGGAAARYTGHSIFFKPAVGRSGLNSSTPIYTHYSNIGGWQSTGNYDDMGDGWYRAHVIFYSAGGGSDGKYWAINPAGATLNIPITVYWAAPFKEDRNDSTHVSSYVNDTRSNTQAILDLTGNNTVTANSLTYASNNTFSFNGSNSITVPFNSSAFTFNNGQTIIIWMQNQSPSSARRNPYNQAYAGAGTITHENDTGFNYFYGTGGGDNSPYTNLYTSFSVVVGETAMICFTRDTSTVSCYKNGVFSNSMANPYGSVVTGTNNITIGSGYAGSFGGSLYAVQLYNRALSAAEVQQNFNALRGRYGL